jgi:hypothetical protein
MLLERLDSIPTFTNPLLNAMAAFDKVGVMLEFHDFLLCNNFSRFPYIFSQYHSLNDLNLVTLTEDFFNTTFDFTAQFPNNSIIHLDDLSYFHNLTNVTATYHYSIPTTKLAYPEPFIASASFMHNDI